MRNKRHKIKRFKTGHPKKRKAIQMKSTLVSRGTIKMTIVLISTSTAT